MFTCSLKSWGAALVLFKLCVKWLLWRMHTFQGKRPRVGTAGAFCLSLWLLCRTHLLACNAPHLSKLHQSALHWPAHMYCVLLNGKKNSVIYKSCSFFFFFFAKERFHVGELKRNVFIYLFIYFPEVSQSDLCQYRLLEFILNSGCDQAAIIMRGVKKQKQNTKQNTCTPCFDLRS